MPNKKADVLSAVFFIYLICFALRIFEYFILRTDQTLWGEAFLHKLAGIAVILAASARYGLNPQTIGFAKQNIGGGFLKGLFLGLAAFTPAYALELIFLSRQAKPSTLHFYVTAYAVDGSAGRQSGLLFLLICIAGNLINVIMEEGLFRGLFPGMLARQYAFSRAAVISSCLFGLWHVAAPLRSYCDKTMSLSGFLANAFLLIAAACLTGFKFSLLTAMTGSLYVAMGDHFVNNAIVNLLHVLSDTGADELQSLRITLAQSISFILVLIWYQSHKKNLPSPP